MTEQELKKLLCDDLLVGYHQKTEQIVMEAYKKGLDTGIEIGKRVAQEGDGWIRTSERLPELEEGCMIRPGYYYQSREVLIDLPGGQLALARYARTLDGACSWRADGGYQYPTGLVLRWRELPEYPKYSEEKEETK